MESIQLSDKQETYLEPELVEKLKARLSRVEGHVRGVSRMLDRKADCNDILIQLSAIEAALKQVTIQTLQGHMRTCVTECLASGDEEAVNDLSQALALVLK